MSQPTMRLSASICELLLGAGLPSAGHAASITARSLGGFPGEDPSISILQVTGAEGIVTQGGIATAETRTL